MEAFLDWRHHRVGPPLPCRLCTRPALMRDENGEPCHKVCADDAYRDDRHEQEAALAVVVELPSAPVIDIQTRRRVA